MKDILDKIKAASKSLLEKVKPALEKVLPFLKDNKRYLATAGLFAVLVLVLVFFTGTEFNAERIAKLNSKEVSGEDYVPDAEFKVDAYPEVNELIAEYFSAYVAADFEALEYIVTPLTDMEKSYITTMSQFYEEYQNITCYTKQGLSKDSYIVSACFDIKFTDQEVTAPSMVLFYVQTKEDGSLYINNLYSDFNLKYSELAINKNVHTALVKYTQQEDYLDLYRQVNKEFTDLIKSNTDIYKLTKVTIPGTRQIWDATVYYVESTEELEDTEDTEAVEVTETPETETESESESETTSEPVVEKVRITSSIAVRVRSGPGTNYTKLGDVYRGAEFVKLGSEMGADGFEWTKVQYTDELVGYIRSDFLEKVTE